ncbi:MAG: DoxX family protein [Verrucomicrobiota bacterium]
MENNTAVKQAAFFALELGARIILGGYFVYAGFTKWFVLNFTGEGPFIKMADLRIFALQISDYQMVNDPFPTLLAISLPWLEMFAGFCIIIRKLYVGGLVTIVGMLAVFMVALANAIARDLEVCGCSGGAKTPQEQLIHDIVLIAIGGALLFRELRRRPS